MRPKSGSCFSAECGLLDLLPLASRDQQYQAPHWLVSHRCWQGDRANNAGDDPLWSYSLTDADKVTYETRLTPTLASLSQMRHVFYAGDDPFLMLLQPHSC